MVVLIRQRLCQRGHSPLLAAHTQRVDDADFGQSGSTAKRVGQRLAGLAGGHGFERIAGRVGQLLVGQQRRKRWDRLIGANELELSAGNVLLREGRVGLQDGNQLLFLVGLGSPR
jgi:hypothetical protein